MRWRVIVILSVIWFNVNGQLLNEPGISPCRDQLIDEQGLKSVTKYKALDTDTGDFIVQLAYEEYTEDGNLYLREEYKGGKLQVREKFYTKDSLGRTFDVKETRLPNGALWRLEMKSGSTPLGPTRFFKFSGSRELLVKETRDTLRTGDSTVLREVKFRARHGEDVRYFSSVKLPRGTRFFTVDGFGRVVEKRRVIRMDSVIQTYDESDSSRLVKEYVPDESAIEGERPLRETFYNEEGQVLTEHKYLYDVKGKNIEKVYSGEFGTTLIIEKKPFDETRLKEEIGYYDGNDEIEFRRKMRYNRKGLLTMEKHWGRNGSPRTLEKFKYDRKGNLVRHLKYRYEGKKKIQYIHNLYDYEWRE